MTWYQALPHVNATLNVTSAVLLVLGYAAIRRGDRRRHARLMIAAFCTSTLFLVSYLIYHYTAGHVRYEGAGVARAIERTEHLLRFTVEECRITVFGGGRALLFGVDDPTRAGALYDRYVGAP